MFDCTSVCLRFSTPSLLLLALLCTPGIKMNGPTLQNRSKCQISLETNRKNIIIRIINIISFTTIWLSNNIIDDIHTWICIFLHSFTISRKNSGRNSLKYPTLLWHQKTKEANVLIFAMETLVMHCQFSAIFDHGHTQKLGWVCYVLSPIRCRSRLMISVTSLTKC